MQLVLRSKESVQEGVISFIFEPQEPLAWEPGQYLHYVLSHEGADDRGLERWFTIASAPYEKNIAITTRFDGERVSSFKSALRHMNEGETIEADGPKGKFVLQPGEHRHIFISGGIGITPFHSMIKQFAHDNHMPKIDLLYANRDGNFVYMDELQKISKDYPSLHIIEFAGKKIEEADLEPYLADESSIFYLSGPHFMVDAYEQLLKNKNIPETAILTDYFPGY